MENIFNREDIYIVGYCRQPAEALNEFKKCNADVVLLDANWHNITGKTLLENFLKMNAKVILTTNFFNADLINYFKPLTPHGYLYRNADNFKSITDCIKTVYRGEPCFADS
jgi:DNA-binding NarL/FixJ family response regulator